VPHFIRVRSPYDTAIVLHVRCERARGAGLYTLPAALLRMGAFVKYCTIRSWVRKAG
jgi:hypothetical protein